MIGIPKYLSHFSNLTLDLETEADSEYDDEV